MKKISNENYEKEIKSKVKEVKYYIDRLLIKINSLPSKKHVEKLLEDFPDQFSSEFPEDSDSTPTQEKFNNRKNGGWSSTYGYLLKIRKPTDSFLEILEETLRSVDYTLTELELAVDLITENTADACELAQLLAPLLVAKFMKSKKKGKKDETDDGCEQDLIKRPTVKSKNGCEIGSIYFGEYGDSRMFKMYVVEEGNPKHGMPALHTELRINGVKNIKSDGFEVLTDFIGADYRKVLDRRVFVGQVNQKAVGEAIRIKNNQPPASATQANNEFIKKFGGELFVANQVYQYFKCDLKQCFSKRRSPWNIIK